VAGASPASYRPRSKEEFARADDPAANILKPISNAACKPQARDKEVTAIQKFFVRRNAIRASFRGRAKLGTRNP